DDSFLFVPPAQEPGAWARLDVHAGETLRALGRAPSGPSALDLRAAAAASHRRRVLTAAADHLRREHALDGAETERRRLCAQDDHGQNADALGTGHRHDQGGECAAAPRLLAES